MAKGTESTSVPYFFVADVIFLKVSSVRLLPKRYFFISMCNIVYNIAN